MLIKIRDNEELDQALRRFRRACEREGIFKEVRRRRHHTPPSVQRQLDIKERERRARRKRRRRP